MKKLLTFITCFICLTMTVILAGCTKQNGGNPSNGGTEQDEGIPFTAQYDWDCSWQQDKTYPDFNVIRTYDDFITYRSDNGLRRVEYEEDYFDGNFVVAVRYSTSNSAIEYVVKKVVSDDGRLVVYISLKDTPPDVAGAAVMGEYFCCIGISNTYSVTDPAITLA